MFAGWGRVPDRLLRDPRVTVVTDPAALPHWHALLKRIAVESWVSWDTETSGFDYFKDARIIGHIFGFDLGDGLGPRGVYFPIRHQTFDAQLPPEWVTWMVGDILGDHRANVVTYNGKFDLHFAAVDGIVVRATLHDAMIMVALFDENRPKELESVVSDWGIDPNAYEMKDVVQKVLGEECKRRGIKKSNAPGFAWVPVEILGPYGCKDGYNTLALAQRLYPIIQRDFAALYATEMRLLRYLQRAEYIGTPIDIPYLLGVHARAEQRAADLEREIQARAGFRLKVSSDVELRGYLYGYLQFPVTHYTKNGQPKAWGATEAERNGTPAVDERALKAMMRANRPGATDFLRALLAWREQDKILSTYTTPIIEKCDARGYLHTSFNQVRTNTGRLSSSQPNLQNIPTDDVFGIRRAFLVPEGYTRIYIDFSQIELRVLAHYSKDPTMVAAFVNGEDIHTRTSMELFNSKEKKWRRIAKVINFGLSYGMSAIGVMENLNATADPEKGIDYVTEEQAQSYLDRFHQRYPRVMGFCEELWQDMRRSRIPQFRNIFGRVRRIHELASSSPRDSRRAERQAVASIIQGTAADIAKESMVRVGDRLEEARAAGRYDGYFVLTVHDENQMDVRTEHAEEAARELKADMEAFPQFAPIAITAEAEWSTTSWADKKPIWKEAA